MIKDLSHDQGPKPMNIQSRAITDELPKDTPLKGGAYRITGSYD